MDWTTDLTTGRTRTEGGRRGYKLPPAASPADATSREAFLTELGRAVYDAHASGGYTAVLRLAQQRQLDLQRESGDPDELHWRRCQWGHVEEQAREPAMNEEHGWTLLPDGSYGKTLPNGQVLSCWGGVSYEEDDGTVVDTSKRDERWLQRHRAICHHFARRTRAERLENVGSRTRPNPQRRAREHRPGKSRRASSSSRTSSTDPGDPDGEPAATPLTRTGVVA